MLLRIFARLHGGVRIAQQRVAEVARIEQSEIRDRAVRLARIEQSEEAPLQSVRAAWLAFDSDRGESE